MTPSLGELIEKGRSNRMGAGMDRSSVANLDQANLPIRHVSFRFHWQAIAFRADGMRKHWKEGNSSLETRNKDICRIPNETGSKVRNMNE